MHRSISVGDCKISAKVFGTGLPIIVIPGGPGLACDYLSSLISLSDDHQVVLFDHPGCGNSTSAADPSAIQAVSAALAVIEEFVGDKKFVLAAHSWGAYIAAQVCLQLRTTPVSTILFNPVPFDRSGFDAISARLVSRVEPDTLERIAELSSSGTMEAGRELMRLAMPAYCGRTDHLPDVSIDFSIETSNAVTASLGEYDTRPAISRLGNLTLVFGTTDYVLDSDFQGVAPHAKRVTLPSGHFCMLDAPAQLIDLIRRSANP